MNETPILDRAQEIQHQLVAWRRDIHMYPELGFTETRTGRLVADTLTAMGVRVKTGVAKTGLIGYIGEGSPVVAIRADMDALPIHEATGLPFASRTPGVMHACGHDAHTAILLGVARLLTEMPDRPDGEIRLLFQPAEEMQDTEGKSGGLRMVEEGALNGVQHVIALHVDSMIPAGKIEVRAGHSQAAADAFYATIIGKGGHGAHPDETIDPTFILAQVINAIHGVRARRINPIRPAVISIGAVHGGDADNVIPDRIDLKGTIRSYDEPTRQRLWRELEAALAVSRAFGGDYALKIVPGYPPVYHDPAVTELIREVAVELAGEDMTATSEPSMGAEDFGYMTQVAPGSMFYLGAKADAKDRPHHSPQFDISEDPLALGAAILTESARRLLLQLNGPDSNR